jgi:Rps23 Pro-64 3,4-dihydroxylase Tpa1-like proline 4-hydroxylase
MDTKEFQNPITNSLLNTGLSILDDILPLEVANQINEAFNNTTEWTIQNQQEKTHYSTEHKSENIFLPQSKECYYAKFSESYTLKTNPLIKDIFYKYFIPLLQQVSPYTINSIDYRCYKLDKGDHYRSHIDDFLGSINLIYYASKEWRWDWGGILNINSHTDQELCYPILPKFNRLVLLNNKIFRSPHHVSSVEHFALNPRYSIVSFNK